MFQESFKRVSWKIQGCFKEVSRVFQGGFKGASRKCQGCFMKVSGRRKFQGCLMIFKDVPLVFQRCLQEVSRKLSRCFNKSFMLHGTHRSFPSRKRACLLILGPRRRDRSLCSLCHFNIICLLSLESLIC